jgi:hypothetical protein
LAQKPRSGAKKISRINRENKNGAAGKATP